MVKTWFQILLYEISFQINAVYIHWQTLDGKNLSFGPKKKKIMIISKTGKISCKQTEASKRERERETNQDTFAKILQIHK